MMSQSSNHTFGQSKHRSHSVSPLGANTVVTYWIQSLFNCVHSTVTFTFLFPPEYNSVDRRFLQSYFEKLQETMYSQGKGHVEEMNKICLFFIMCYEVRIFLLVCLTYWQYQVYNSIQDYVAMYLPGENTHQLLHVIAHWHCTNFLFSDHRFISQL